MSTTLVSIDAVLVRDADSNPQLIPVRSASCRSCGMCSSAYAPGGSAPADAGAVMRLSMPGAALLFVAIGTYGIPFAGLLCGALLAAVCGAGDAGAALAASAGCLIAVGASGRAIRRCEARALAQLRVRSGEQSRRVSGPSDAESASQS